MASLEQRNRSYRVVFRFAGRKYSRSLRTRSRVAAAATLARLEDNLRRAELGTLVVPDDADVASFLLSDGQHAAQSPKARAPQLRTLGQLLDAFLAQEHAAVESSTLDGMRIHIRHLMRVLGVRRQLLALTSTDLQDYIDRRSRERGLRGRSLSPATIKKELTTLHSVWRWGTDMGLISRPLSKNGIRFPKGIEKPSFQTWAEIERKIARGGISSADQADLWDCLFLTLPEICELLGYVQTHARQPFIYPMFVFAAHTGARRSEMMRAEIDDIDFSGQRALIREKKRVRGKLTTRTVPISPLLTNVLEQWIAEHSGGNMLFCPERRSGPARAPLTRDQAHDHFKRTVGGSKWDKLRGWHVFRHSFCSNCAAAGIDQRIINAWVGHQTEEMVKRYRHLIPNQEQEAIQTVFPAT